MSSPKEKTVIGVVCPVLLKGGRAEERVEAKIDTGATRTSVDTELAARVGLGPITDIVKVRAASANQSEVRPLVMAHVRLGEQAFDLPVNIADRKGMKYPVIVGMDILSQGHFLVDPAGGEGDV